MKKLIEFLKKIGLLRYGSDSYSGNDYNLHGEILDNNRNKKKEDKK